jgi:hypothetical protein
LTRLAAYDAQAADQQATGRLESWPLAERWNGRAWTVVAMRT